MSKHYYSIFGPSIKQFISYKNSLGYKFKDAGNSLLVFDQLAYDLGLSEIKITKEIASDYGRKRSYESDNTRYNRIQVLAQYSLYLNSLDIDSYVPKLPRIKKSFVPYIFSKEQIQRIFEVCNSLDTTPSYNSSVYTIPVLIRLLYGTGIRISEAMSLKCNDFNLSEKFLILRKTKNGSERMIPYSDSVASTLEEYYNYRVSMPFLIKGDSFFVKKDGTQLGMTNLYKWFRKIIFAAGITHGGKGYGPRVHDLRHTFSVHSLARMAEGELDLYYSLPILSTYLGHQSLEATDAYVRLTYEMYPDIINKTSPICAKMFPTINTKENYETN